MNHNKGECGSGQRHLLFFCKHGTEFWGSAIVENFLTMWPTATLSIGP